MPSCTCRWCCRRWWWATCCWCCWARAARSAAGSTGHFDVQLVFTTLGAAVATAVMSFPLMVRAMRISLENVDRGLEDAARTLGAGPLATLRHHHAAPDAARACWPARSPPSPRASASSARSSPSCRTSPARRARCRWRCTRRCSHRMAMPRRRGWRCCPSAGTWRAAARRIAGARPAPLAGSLMLRRRRHGCSAAPSAWMRASRRPRPASPRCSAARVAARPRWSI